MNIDQKKVAAQADHDAAIADLIAALQSHLATPTPVTWGTVADAGYVRARLAEAAAFVGAIDEDTADNHGVTV
jgi:hypothetical protein